MKIFLIGFMGSGKSYSARMLAESLSYPSLDLDDIIEEKAGMSVSQIFEQEGEKAFRVLEHDSLMNLIREKENFVLATGGGAPCFLNNMEIMNEAGITIFLDASPALIFERIKDTGSKRPLLLTIPPDELKSWILKKMKERLPYYSKAHLSLDIQKHDQEAYLELLDYLNRFDH